MKRYHAGAKGQVPVSGFGCGGVEVEGGSQGSEEGCSLCLWESWEAKKMMIDFLLTLQNRRMLGGFLRDLYERGLEGKVCERITADGGAGLLAALEIIYPRITQQYCYPQYFG